MSTERRGPRVARLFRKARKLPDIRACDLDAILAGDNVDVCESFCVDPGYTALLVRPGNDVPPGIMLAAGQSQGRRRFSIAHELGHLYIPTHEHRTTEWCGDSDMTARSERDNTYESEANDFAAELLMPRHLFSKDAANLVPAFRDISRLAGEGWYNVSMSAASLRFVEITQNACALVASKTGRIQWVAKSDSFVYRVPWRGDNVPSESLAASALVDEATQQPCSLDPYVWLELEQRRRVEFFESTHIVGHDQVLSLIWVVEETFSDE